jgi:hypothetical protein
MICDCKVTRAYTVLCADVTSNVKRTNADLVRGVKKTFVFLHVFFLILHVVLLYTVFMFYSSAMVKATCPPVNVCAPTPVCTPCPPLAHFQARAVTAARIRGWEVRVTDGADTTNCKVQGFALVVLAYLLVIVVALHQCLLYKLRLVETGGASGDELPVEQCASFQV